MQEESRKEHISGSFWEAPGLQRLHGGEHLSLFTVRLKTAPLPAVHVVLGAVGATAW